MSAGLSWKGETYTSMARFAYHLAHHFAPYFIHHFITTSPTTSPSDYKFDFLSFNCQADKGYLHTFSVGGQNYNSPVYDNASLAQYEEWEWLHNVITYNRTTDVISFYNDGNFVGNYTNNQHNEMWKTSLLATKFGRFGKVSADNDEGIDALSVGCRALKEATELVDIYAHRGGLDDLAIYDAVLSAEEVKR